MLATPAQSQQVSSAIFSCPVLNKICLHAGVLAAQPLSAEAITVPECEQLTTAANGIQFCDTKEGSGKTPAKGALIRSWPFMIAQHNDRHKFFQMIAALYSALSE